MDAAFVLEPAVDVVAGNFGDDLLDPAALGFADRHDFDLPLVDFGVAAVHPVDLLGEKCSLVAACPGPDLKDRSLLVKRIVRQQKNVELFRDFVVLLFEFRQLQTDKLDQFGILLDSQHLLLVGYLVFELVPLKIVVDDVFEAFVFAHQLRIFFDVSDSFGFRDLLFQIQEALVDLGEFVFDFEHCRYPVNKKIPPTSKS